MWFVVTYLPTSLFSLRPANATTSGGKTLLTPTPFALKMALLDAAIRVYGKGFAESWFPAIRDLEIAIQLPYHLMVTKTFVKILRPHKNGAKDSFGTGLLSPMGNTIAYREMVQFGSEIKIAFWSKTETDIPFLQLFSQIHYLGKRGGFMQFQAVEVVDELELSVFTKLTSSQADHFPKHGTMQLLDNCGSKMGFAHADIYSGKPLAVGKENGRILNPVILPYRLSKSSRSFSLYEQIGS